MKITPKSENQIVITLDCGDEYEIETYADEIYIKRPKLLEMNIYSRLSKRIGREKFISIQAQENGGGKS